MLSQVTDLDIKTYDMLRNFVIYFISTHKYMPQKIYILFDQYFEFKSDVLNLREKFSNEIIEDIIKHIEIPDCFNYKNLQGISKENTDKYLKLREMILYAIKCGNFKDAEKFMEEANSIYDKDLELIKLNAKLKYYSFQYKQAKNILKTYLKMKKDDKEAKNLLRKCNNFNYIDRKIDIIFEKFGDIILKIITWVKGIFYLFLILAVMGMILSQLE